MAVKYTLEFQTNTGSDITYELDILDTSFSGTATKLKGQESPIEIEWKTDRDVYSPLIGSKASINLLLEDGDAIDDFNAAAEFTYEVRLRYKDSDDNLHDVWKGWIDPNDGEERFGSFPLPVSYVATDGLGKLNGKVDAPDARGNVLLLHYILDALEDTGLGLDVLIDSSLQDEDGNDPLTTVMVNELAFIDEDPEMTYGDDGFNADTKKDVLEGILSAFNCSVRQAEGKWWIINNSLYSGNTSRTFQAYEYNTASSNKIDRTNYEKVTDVGVSDFDYELSSSADTDLFIHEESLYFLPRYPYGSIECVPSNLRKIKPTINPNFDAGEKGWRVGPQSSIQSLSIQQPIGNLFVDKGYVINTTRNVHPNSQFGDNDTWFETDPDYAGAISKGTPHDLSFDWNCNFVHSSTDSARLYFQVYVEFSSTVTVSRATNDDGEDRPEYWHPNDVLLNQTYNFTRLYYNPDFEEWGLNQRKFVSVDVGTENEWTSYQLKLPDVKGYIETLGGSISLPEESPKIYIRFLYPTSYNRTGQRSAEGTTSSGNISFYIDNVSIEPDYSSDPTTTFERVQANYTSTLQYNPKVIGSSELDRAYYEILDTTSYWEENQNVSVDAARDLEQVVTNQKLKDYQGQFYSWEATFVNNNDVPVSMMNLINISSSVTGQNLDEDVLAIMRGGTFNPKNNLFKATLYSPNQTSETDFGDFFYHNVNLVSSPPPERSREKTIVISHVLSAVDDDDNEVEDGLITGDRWTIARGLPGQAFQRSFIVRASDENEIDGTLELLDTESNPAPTYARNFTFERLGSFVEVSYIIEIPEESEYEEAYIHGTVDALVGDNSRVIFDADNSGLTNASNQQGGGEITEIGPVGSTEKFIYYIEADDTYEIKPDGLTVTIDSVKDGPNASDSDVSNIIDTSDIQKVSTGTGVAVIIPFQYTETSPVYVKLSFDGTATSIATEDTVSVQVKATETGTETDDWSITDDDITLTGVPGTPFTFIFEINPESGKYVDAGSITLGSIEESYLGDYHVISSQQASSEALIFLSGTFPTEDKTGDDAANITINCNVVDPASTTAVAHTFTWAAPADANYFFNNKANSYSASLEPGEVATFNISMEANSGYRLGTVDLTDKSVTYDVELGTLPTGVSIIAQTPYHTNGIIENVDYTMKVVGQSTSQTGTVALTGTAGTQGNLYTLRININSTDAFNAKTSTSFIDVPFGDADLGDNDTTDRTFTVESAEGQMVYDATDDISLTSSDTSILANANVSASSISDGVITVTIDQITIPSSAPTTGLVEIDLVVGGPAATLQDATMGEIFFGTDIGGSSSEVNFPRDATVLKVKVVTDGKWARTFDYSPTCNNVYQYWAGSGSTQDADQTLGYVWAQTFANTTGSDRCFRMRIHPQSDTDTTLDTMVIRQRGRDNLDSASGYGTDNGDAVAGIWIGSKSDYDGISGKGSDNIMYFYYE